MKTAYENRLQQQLDEWDAKIEGFMEKAKISETDEQHAYYLEIRALRAKQEAAKQKLIELKVSGHDTWEDLKEDIENLWDSLGDAVKSFLSK